MFCPIIPIMQTQGSNSDINNHIISTKKFFNPCHTVIIDILNECFKILGTGRNADIVHR